MYLGYVSPLFSGGKRGTQYSVPDFGVNLGGGPVVYTGEEDDR